MIIGSFYPTANHRRPKIAKQQTRIRQNNHRLYHESVKCEIKFKEAAQAMPIDIEMLTKENRNDNKT